MLDILKAVILGVIEGITEWLPISSTGHMILADEFIKMGQSADFMKMFLVVIQLGAILGVIVLYFNKLNPFSKRKKKKQRDMTIQLWVKVLIACIPAAVIGLLLDDWLDAHFYNYVTVSLMLILYGILFIVVENKNRFNRPKIEKLSQLPYSTAALIGVFQVLALIPGTSRSGATILGGIILGASRQVAAEFTFFLAIPVMFGASLLKIVKYGLHFTGLQVGILLVGMLVAFIVSIWAIKFLMNYIKKNDFKAFGYYRIILGAVVLFYFLIFS